MYVCFVDRIGAHSIWRLVNSIASEVLSNHGKVAYVRWDDGRQLDPLQTPAGVEIHDILVSPKRFPWQVIKQEQEFCTGLRSWLSEMRPDVVHTNFCLPGSVSRRVAKKRFNIPVVTTCHELYGSMNAYLRRGIRQTQPFVDRTVFISQTVAESYGTIFENRKAETNTSEEIIYNGVDTEAIRNIALASGRRVSNRLVSAGRLVPEKGYRDVILAIANLVPEFPELRYRLIGEGPERENLSALVKRLRIDQHVELLGWLSHDEVIREMSCASAVAMPSKHEGFGLALVEAMCCGAQVVASDIPAFLEVASRNSPGVSFYRRNDPASLAKQLRTALLQAGSAPASSNEDYRWIANKFSCQQMAAKYVALYSELVS